MTAPIPQQTSDQHPGAGRAAAPVGLRGADPVRAERGLRRMPGRQNRPRSPSDAVQRPRHPLWSAARHLCALGLAVIAAAGVWPAHAEKADRDQPLTFSADRMRLDEKRRVRVLTGDVEIAKGTLLIRAAQIELRETAQGQTAVATGSNGKPATFRQKREGVDEVVEGQAQRIDYDARNDTVRFTQQASVRRYRGTVLADEISGQSISYDADSEVIEVQGGSASGTAASSGRVRGVLAPTPAPAAASR